MSLKISTKSQYGLRALFDIAFHSGNQPTQIREIARRQKISAGYLEQIFQDLKKAGLLQGKRGPRGGYILARSPKNITVLDILLATGTEIALVECTLEKQAGAELCDFHQQCVPQTIWDLASRQLRDYFSSLTLKDLCEQAREMGMEKEQAHRFLYFI